MEIFMEIKSINWGNPKPSLNYNFILDAFSNTKINSNQTSSIPLAQYWKDYTNNLQKLTRNLHLESKTCELFFEYPTPSYSNNKSSFTDLMIFTEIAKIAIEAKYTELMESYETITKWFQSAGSKTSEENRKNVLNHWASIIKPFTECQIDETSQIPYQFLHRTASSCFETKNAVVIYQVFYDVQTKSKLQGFKDTLVNAIQLIKPKSQLKFYLHAVELISTPTYSTNKEELDSIFQEIKTKKLYKFGSEHFTELKG